MLQTKGSNPLFATISSNFGFFRQFSWKTGLTSVGHKVCHSKAGFRTTAQSICMQRAIKGSNFRMFIVPYKKKDDTFVSPFIPPFFRVTLISIKPQIFKRHSAIKHCRTYIFFGSFYKSLDIWVNFFKRQNGTRTDQIAYIFILLVCFANLG